MKPSPELEIWFWNCVMAEKGIWLFDWFQRNDESSGRLLISPGGGFAVMLNCDGLLYELVALLTLFRLSNESFTSESPPAR